MNIRLPPLPLRQHKRRRQRHVHIPKRRIGALHRPRPQPSDHRELPPHIVLQIGAVLGHLRRHFHLRIQVPDALLGFVAHPLAVVAHVLGQPLGALPLPLHAQLAVFGHLRPRFGVHRRHAGELGRNLDHRLVDKHRHGVQVRSVGLQPQPLRLQRQRAAAGERIVEGRQPLRIEQFRGLGVVLVLRASAPPATPNLVARLLQQRLVGGVLPLHKALNQPKQPLPLRLLRRLGGELLRPRSRIIHHLREDHRPRRRQRPPRPPQMQRARMPMPNRLLPRGLLVDGVQRQRDLDELLSECHVVQRSSNRSACPRALGVPVATDSSSRWHAGITTFPARTWTTRRCRSCGQQTARECPLVAAEAPSPADGLRQPSSTWPPREH